METGEYNADAAADFLHLHDFHGVEILQDLEGQKRVVVARRPSK